MKLTKRQQQLATMDRIHNDLQELLQIIRSTSTAKFTESVELAIELGINAKRSDESVRGNVELPFGIAKKMSIAVIAPAELHDLLRDAGADTVGGEELIAQIKTSNQIGFDVVLASSNMLTKVLSIAKILGKAGVMPNLKDGTVSDNIVDALKKIRQGKKLIVRNDPAGYVQCCVGKVNSSDESLEANIKAVVNFLLQSKPLKVKTMVKRISISSTMGIGLNLPLRYIS